MFSTLVFLAAGVSTSANAFYEPADNFYARPFYKTPLPHTDYEDQPHLAYRSQSPYKLRTAALKLIKPAPVYEPSELLPLPLHKPSEHLPLSLYKPSEHLPLPVYKPSEHLPLPLYKPTEHLHLPVYKPSEHLPLPVYKPSEHLPLSVYKPSEHLQVPVYKPSDRIPLPIYKPIENEPMPLFKATAHISQPVTLYQDPTYKVTEILPSPLPYTSKPTTSQPGYHQLSHHKEASSFQNVAYQVSQQAYREVEHKPQSTAAYS